jgi:hypothetical protein
MWGGKELPWTDGQFATTGAKTIPSPPPKLCGHRHDSGLTCLNREPESCRREGHGASTPWGTCVTWDEPGGELRLSDDDIFDDEQTGATLNWSPGQYADKPAAVSTLGAVSVLVQDNAWIRKTDAIAKKWDATHAKAPKLCGHRHDSGLVCRKPEGHEHEEPGAAMHRAERPGLPQGRVCLR